MASQGIWFGSFLVCGLLLQASKGGFVGYHLITNGEQLYQAQHQQKITQSQLGLLDGLSTTDSSKKLNTASTTKGMFISKLIPGLEGYTSMNGQNAEYKTSSWNQNQYKNLTTTEPTLGESDRLNTTNVTGDVEPVAKSTGAPIDKSVLGQDINDVINPGYEVTDGGRVSPKHMPLNQHQNLTTSEPQFGAFDRINATDVSDAFHPAANNQSQNRTTTEPQMEIVEKINTTDAFEKFDSASYIQAQNRTATETRLGVLDVLNTTETEPETYNQTQTGTQTESQLVVIDRIITNNVSIVLGPEIKNQPQNWTRTEPQLRDFDRINTTDAYEESEPADKRQVQKLTATEPQLEGFDKTNATDVFEEFETETNNEAQNQTATDLQIGVFERINTTDVSKEFEPEKNNRDQNRTQQILQFGVVDKINTNDVYEAFEQETNNQGQNRTKTEPPLGVFERINTTEVSEDFEPARNNQAQNRTGIFDIINTTDVREESAPEGKIHTEQRKITDTQLMVFDRVNTTDVPKEFEAVRNYKGVIFNKPVDGQEMDNDITAEGRTISNDDKVSDTSLLQNQTNNRITTYPRLGTFYTVNATGFPDALESISNSTGVVMNQSVFEQEIQNATARFENGRLIQLVKQGVTKLQVVDSQGADNQSKQTNRSVTTIKSLAMKENESKGKVQVQLVNRQKKGNEVAQPKHSRKRGQHKGHTVIKAGKANRTSSPKPRAQNRNNTRFGTFDRANTTNSTDEFQPVTNLTGVVINQLVPGHEIPKDTLIGGNIIMNQKVRYTSLSPYQTQNGTTAEPRLGAIDRINKTDIPEALESVTNSTGAAINESIPGQQMQNDTLFSEHNIIDRANMSDTSLSQNQTQNRTTTEPRLGTFDKVNTTHDPEGSEPVTNLTSAVVDQLVPGQEIHNATLRSATSTGSTLIKQGVTKQAAKRGAKSTDWNVRIGKDLKDQVQIHSSVKRKQGNVQAKAKNDRKQGNGTMSKLTKQGITKLQAFESGAKKAEARVRIINILATKEKDSSDPVQLHSVNKQKQENEQEKANTSRKNGDTVINPNKVSHNYLSTTLPQHRTTIETTPHGAFDRVNASNVTDELKMATNSTDVVMNQPVPGQEMNNDTFISGQTMNTRTNISDASLSQNQTQNRTTKESSLGPYYNVKIPDGIEELESMINSTGVGINSTGVGNNESLSGRQIREDTLSSALTISIRENDSDTSLNQQKTKNQMIKESHLGTYRVNTTDNIEELESVANSTGVGINEPISGRQMRKDALFSGHTSINPEEIRNTSLSPNQTQNRTTKEPHFGVFDRVSTTKAHKVLEPVTNFTGLVSDQPIPGQERQNPTLKSGKEDMSTSTTQRVTSLQAANSGAHQANESVRIVNTLGIKEKDSKGQVQPHTTIKEKKGNKPAKARNTKKQGRRKGTDNKRDKN